MIRPIVAVRLVNEKNGRQILTYGMIDTGCDRDIIADHVAQYLELEERVKLVTINTVETGNTLNRRLTDVRLEAMDKSYMARVGDALIGTILTNTNDVPPAKRDSEPLPHGEGVTFIDIEAVVSVIISVGHADTWTDVEARKGKPREPILLKTAFGWTMLGRSGSTVTNISCGATSVEFGDVREGLDRIFYHDFAIVSEEELGESLDNREAVEQLKKSICFNDDRKKYMIDLPWKGGRENAMKKINAVDSRSTALKRLRGTAAQLRRDDEKKERVFAEMEKFVKLGYASVIEDLNDDTTTDRPRWYLPLHVVEKGGKTRVCHDARASTNGVCLNDMLHGKLNLNNELMTILCLFRTEKVAFTTDICAFFHNVLVSPIDADAFRYFWFTDESMTTVQLLRFNAHVFGSAASSFVTSFVLRYHAERLRASGRYADETCDVIRKRSYVDDLSATNRRVPTAKTVKGELISGMAEGGFTLAKWATNFPEILEGLPSEVVKSFGTLDDNGLTKVLGISWETKGDRLTFVFDDEKTRSIAKTPRQLVAVQATLYDPLGLISPFQLFGRQMLQQSMVGNKGWDSPLDPELQQRFQRWQEEIPLLAHLSIPRWWDTDGTVDPVDEQLHIFSDAASTAYGCCAYRRVVGKDGEIFVTLLTARSHVVPLNPSRSSHHNSIPRLELVAAKKAVEVRLFLERALEKKFPKTVMWCDSQCVLKQIMDRESRFNQFTTNRLSFIHAGSKITDWRFCYSGDNPSDLPSRGIHAGEHEKWRIFHGGPDFLWRPENEWPANPLAPPAADAVNVAFLESRVMLSNDNDGNANSSRRRSDDGQEEGEDTALATVAQEDDRILVAASRISDYVCKVRCIARIQAIARFWKNFRRPAHTTRSASSRPKVTLVVMSNDFRQAENLLLQRIQNAAFPTECRLLQKHEINAPNLRKEMTKRNSALRKHNPFLDHDNLIKVGSRLTNSSIAAEAKYPIILPKGNEDVRALIRHTHDMEMHAGPKHVLGTLRQRYWILQGLQEVTNIVKKCITCQKAFKAPLTQKMAPLPAARVTPGQPFQDTGLDLMGPFGVKMSGRATHKVWVVVFTCFRTRSVHSELVYNMDTSSCINAIVRFSARRPGAQNFMSDRGSNLMGADRVLKDELQKWNSLTAKDLQRRGLQWDFIPADAPHRGGVWERMVGLFKKHLKATMGGVTVHVDVFNTVIIEIEAVINRRPLTAISADSRDCEALTPAHILYPAASTHSSAAVTENVGDPTAEQFRERWRHSQAVVNAFWKTWSRDYLSLLHQRNKWADTIRDLKVGDLVLIVDELSKRHEWKLARVHEVTSTDGHVRSATVRRPDRKLVLRDRSKLVLLELD